MDTIPIIYCILSLMCSAGVGFCVQRFVNLLAASPQAIFGQMCFATHFFDSQRQRDMFNANGANFNAKRAISTPTGRFLVQSSFWQ